MCTLGVYFLTNNSIFKLERVLISDDYCVNIYIGFIGFRFLVCLFPFVSVSGTGMIPVFGRHQRVKGVSLSVQETVQGVTRVSDRVKCRDSSREDRVEVGVSGGTTRSLYSSYGTESRKRSSQGRRTLREGVPWVTR